MPLLPISRAGCNSEFIKITDCMLTVYVETSIVSYLRSRAASHVVAAARQLLTRRWWDEERHRYDLVISQYVLDEA